jgi:hypothetical protein
VTVAATAVSGLIALHGGFPAAVGFTALARRRDQTAAAEDVVAVQVAVP